MYPWVDATRNARREPFPVFLLAEDGERGSMPLYYVFGSEESIRTADAFARIVDDRGPTLDDLAYRQAAQLAEGAADGIVPHHRAILSPP